VTQSVSIVNWHALLYYASFRCFCCTRYLSSRVIHGYQVKRQIKLTELPTTGHTLPGDTTAFCSTVPHNLFAPAADHDRHEQREKWAQATAPRAVGLTVSDPISAAAAPAAIGTEGMAKLTSSIRKLPGDAPGCPTLHVVLALSQPKPTTAPTGDSQPLVARHSSKARRNAAYSRTDSPIEFADVNGNPHPWNAPGINESAHLHITGPLLAVQLVSPNESAETLDDLEDAVLMTFLDDYPLDFFNKCGVPIKAQIAPSNSNEFTLGDVTRQFGR
jgi:hypothetical protein